MNRQSKSITVSLSLKDCVQTIAQSLARLHPNLSLRPEAYTANAAKSVRLKGTDRASPVSTPLLTLHTPVSSGSEIYRES